MKAFVTVQQVIGRSATVKYGEKEVSIALDRLLPVPKKAIASSHSAVDESVHSGASSEDETPASKTPTDDEDIIDLTHA